MDASIFLAVGRIVFGAFFLIACFRNFRNFRERKARATNYGWRLPWPLMTAGFAMQGIGGLSLVFLIWPLWGALLLILFLIMATGLYHNPLMFSGEARAPNLYLMLVNITLAGGLLMVIASVLE
ncbi:MAG: DoxX family protein [Rhizobiaceae bacterium]